MHPSVSAHVSSSSLQFRDLRDVQLDTTAAYDLAARNAEVSALQVRGPWGAVTGNGVVAVDGSGQSRVQATIDKLDAGSIMRALRLPFVAATQVNGTLQAEWPGLDYLKARGAADATLRPTASEMSRSAMPLGGRLMAARQRRSHRCTTRAGERPGCRGQRDRRPDERSAASGRAHRAFGGCRTADLVDRSLHRAASRVAASDADCRRGRSHRAPRGYLDAPSGGNHGQLPLHSQWERPRESPSTRMRPTRRRDHDRPRRHHLATGTSARRRPRRARARTSRSI